MAEISATAVKELREKSGAGMMQCKKALQETNGDVEKAIEYLRKQGQITAGKRADRAAKEGKVACRIEGRTAVMLELNSETDFVALNDDFNALIQNLLTVAMAVKPSDTEAFLNTATPVFNGRTVQDAITEKVGVIGEKISLRRVCVLEESASAKIFSYIHMGGKIGVLLKMQAAPETALKDEKVLELGKDLCLHVCASNPLAIDSTGIPAAKVEKEKEIYREIALKEGKPEKILDKIVAGRVEKFYKESCLINQLFVKNDELTVEKHIEAVAKAAGAKVTVEKFIRYQLGVED